MYERQQEKNISNLKGSFNEGENFKMQMNNIWITASVYVYFKTLEKQENVSQV